MDLLTCIAGSTVIGSIAYILLKESGRRKSQSQPKRDSCDFSKLPQYPTHPLRHERRSLYYAKPSLN